MIVVHSTEFKAIDLKKPLLVTSSITGNVVRFQYDAEKTAYECEMNDGWDGEEYHLYFTDLYGKGITLNVWDSPNFH
jgi:hypothetical protein